VSVHEDGRPSLRLYATAAGGSCRSSCRRGARSTTGRRRVGCAQVDAHVFCLRSGCFPNRHRLLLKFWPRRPGLPFGRTLRTGANPGAARIPAHRREPRAPIAEPWRGVRGASGARRSRPRPTGAANIDGPSNDGAPATPRPSRAARLRRRAPRASRCGAASGRWPPGARACR